MHESGAPFIAFNISLFLFATLQTVAILWDILVFVSPLFNFWGMQREKANAPFKIPAVKPV